MSSPLFRAIQPDAHHAMGTAIFRSPGAWATAGFLVLAALLTAIFIGVMPYARTQSTIGLVVPVAGTVRIAAPRSGTLGALFVSDGAMVEAGAPLFTVDTSRSLQGGSTVDAGVGRALDAQQSQLEQQIGAETIRAGHERLGLEGRIAGIEAALLNMQEQRTLVLQRVAIALARLNGVADLRRRGLITEADFHAREDALLARRQELAALDQQRDTLDQAARQAAIQIAQLPSDSTDRVARLRGAIAEIERQKVQAVVEGGEVVRAPVASRVTALQAAAGQHVGPGKPVLALVPQENGARSSMRAELFVPSRAIGFVRPGQSVRLMFDAFPFQRFGAYAGTVDAVSETMLAPDEVEGPVRPAGPVYRVSVRLDRGTVAVGGRDVKLQPDMTLRADIVLERHTVLQWLLDPVLAAGRSIRS